MRRNPISRGCCYWNVIAVVAVALGSVVCGKAASAKSGTPNSSKWNVTVDVSKTPPALRTAVATLSGTGCPYASNPTPSTGDVYKACPNDQVTWQVTGTATSSTDPIVVFATGKVFVRNSTPVTDTLTGTGSITATLTPPTPGVPFCGEYYVAVLDNTKWYTADPKILIGGGQGILALLRELQRSNHEQALTIKSLKRRIEELEKQLKNK